MKVVTISGSVREGNNTVKALKVVEEYLVAQGVEVERIDPIDLNLSLPGLEETADSEKIKALVESADGIVMATPEYHGSYSSVMKLIIDNLGFPSKLAGKPVTLLGVAAGQIGAVKALEHLRSVTAHLGMFPLPKSVSVPNVFSIIGDNGELSDESINSRLAQAGQGLIDFLT